MLTNISRTIDDQASHTTDECPSSEYELDTNKGSRFNPLFQKKINV